jgi:predicted CXXCH cytochrome family protein
MKPTWHKPAEDSCVSCHSPHESDLPRVLLKKQPALCLECHDETAQRFAKFAVRHQALDRDRSCSGCHNPHASTLSRLLVAESADLCLKCHNRSFPREDEPPLPDLAAELKDFPQWHGPVREKNCEGCHDPHGSAYFRLLTRDYPARFYAPFKEESYDLCFVCHSRDLVRQERSTDTNFRDGDHNMHYLHVNREKGRTCRACHAVHASKEPHHLRATTPFGKWELPVGYKKLPEGGTCATGCHVERAYKRSGP